MAHVNAIPIWLAKRTCSLYCEFQLYAESQKEHLSVLMDANHTAMLLHTNIRWPSRGRVLKHVCDLRKEIGIFPK